MLAPKIGPMTIPGFRSARVAQALLESIATGTLRPSDTIDVAQCCRQHRVSRTVVREALAELAGKGLVVARPGIDTTVAAAGAWQWLDPTFLHSALLHRAELMSHAGMLRSLVEPGVAAQAARQAGERDRSVLLLTLRRLAAAVGSGSRPARVAHESALHGAIARASGNPLMRSLDRALDAVRRAHFTQRHRAERVTRPGQDVPHSDRLLHEHTQLVMAVVRGQPGNARLWAQRLAEPPASSTDAALPQHPTPSAVTRAGIQEATRRTRQPTSPPGVATAAHPVDAAAESDGPDGPPTRPMPAYVGQG